MTQPRPALLAYDGSPSSATSIAVAGRLLRGREAVVCHVWSGVSQAKVVAEGVALARSVGLEARPSAHRRQTKTWRAILDAVEESGATVLVCGAHGISGVGRALLGSVSTSLLHHSQIPTLVVPRTTSGEAMSGPPLLCYDGSDGAKDAIAAAGELLSARRALVFHCWESWASEAPALAGVSATVQGMAAELDEVATQQSRDGMNEGIDVAERAGFKAEGLSERAPGPIWTAALDAADQRASSVIVAGSRGLTGVSAALGSVSNGIVHHSRRPVLVVPPEEKP